MPACIIGWAHSRFGKLDDEDVESLVTQVATTAMEDADVEPASIDEIFVGTMNGGFVRQNFPASLVMQAHPALRFKPATRVENACASGSAAIYQGLNSIEARRARKVLVIGVEKMTEVRGVAAREILMGASYVKEEARVEGGFASIFGEIAEAYFERYGSNSETLARIAAKNHKNGALNPLAHIQKDLGFEFCNTVSAQNPLVAGPLRRTDCSPISDGAAALVLADAETARSSKKAISFRASEQVNDYLPLRKRDVVAFEGPEFAWKRALGRARIQISDLSLAEVHDCFTITELLTYEAMGLTHRGQGARAILEGWTEIDGKLPINPSGGLKAKGHPIGATGVSMHVLSSMQLTGTAGGIQVKEASVAGVFNMGGAAVANYVSILERVR